MCRSCSFEDLCAGIRRARAGAGRPAAGASCAARLCASVTLRRRPQATAPAHRGRRHPARHREQSGPDGRPPRPRHQRHARRPGVGRVRADGGDRVKRNSQLSPPSSFLVGAGGTRTDDVSPPASASGSGCNGAAAATRSRGTARGARATASCTTSIQRSGPGCRVVLAAAAAGLRDGRVAPAAGHEPPRPGDRRHPLRESTVRKRGRGAPRVLGPRARPAPRWTFSASRSIWRASWRG